MLATEGVAIEFNDSGLAEIARIAARANSKAENIGARRLYTIMEHLLDEISFAAPERSGAQMTVDAAYVTNAFKDLTDNEDLTKYIL